MTTQPLPTLTPPPVGGGSRRLVVILSVIGGVLLLTVVALVFLIVGRGLGSPAGDAQGGATPSATPTASPTPTSAETTAPPPVDTTPRFSSFEAQMTVECPQDGEKPEIMFTWTTANATEVWYTSGDDDAIDDAYMQVPLSGSQDDLTDEHLFPCNHRGTQDYTLTLLGDDGTHVSQHWTVTDLSWTGNDDNGNNGNGNGND